MQIFIRHSLDHKIVKRKSFEKLEGWLIKSDSGGGAGGGGGVGV